MTLYERARQVEAASRSTQPVVESALLLLRNQVRQLVSVDEVAAMARTNPSRARSEIRNACKPAFEKPNWKHLPDEERGHLTVALLDSIFGFGPIEDLIDDQSVTEVMINGPRSVFFERNGRIEPFDRVFENESELMALIDRILGPLGRRVDEASPMVNARLPQGHRVNIVLPPISLVGPTVTIRKFTERVISLDDMVDSGTITPELRQLLIWAVRSRKSIAVSGGTGSGKTTLLNALSCVIPHDERIVTIEDSAELRFFEHPHVVGLEARPRNAEGFGAISIRDLVTNALRMRPDRIVVGECRGEEALDMLQAMNTGHDGSLTTLHANSPVEAISRLTTMVRYGAELPVDVIEANIASAVDVIVQTQRALDGSRRVSDVVELRFDRNEGKCVVAPLYRHRLTEPLGTWIDLPTWIDFLPKLGCATEEEVLSWKQDCSCARPA